MPLLVPSLVLALPPGMQALELRLVCDGPVLAALQRFTQLRSLRITGSGADIDWSAAGSGALDCTPAVWSEALEALSLDYRGPAEEGPDGDYLPVIRELPERTAMALAGAAARLARLELRLVRSCSVPELCKALPALRTLRWGCCPAAGG